MSGSFRVFASLVFPVLLLVGLAAGANAGETGGRTDVSAARAAYGSPEEVNGVFRMILDGRSTEAGYSFYVESDSEGVGTVLCSTDPGMVEAGYSDCGPGTLEVPFVAPAGEEVSYRILGNLGNELSQFVVSEGSQVAAEGMVIEGSYSFREDTDDKVDPVDEAAGAQYAGESDQVRDTSSGEASSGGIPAGPQGDDAEEAPGSGIASSVAAIAGAGLSGLLPQSGGSPIVLVAGGALLIAAGGLLMKKVFRG